MSCTLDITISGLCLLARDDTHRQMHVLLPRTDKPLKGCDGGPGHPAHPHVARLSFEKKYAPNVSNPAPRDLAGVAQDIGALPGSADTSYGVATDAIADITAVTGARVQSRYLTDPPKDDLLSRLTLNAGGLTWYRPGVSWKFGGKEIDMTPEILWRLQIPQDSITLKVAGESIELKAVQKRIAFAIYHVPPDEQPPGGNVPPEPGDGDAPKHFPAFYSLFSPVDTIKCPHYKKPKSELNAVGPWGLFYGTSPYTCMLGGGGG